MTEANIIRLMTYKEYSMFYARSDCLIGFLEMHQK